MRIGIYPGTLDPITNGHLDIIGRSFYFLDHLIIAIGPNPRKVPMFDTAKRIELIHDAISSSLKLNSKQYTVSSFDGLMTTFAKSIKAQVIVRGVRNINDFTYESEMAAINKTLAPDIETVMLTTKPGLAIVSSSGIKELYKYGGDISNYVQPGILKAMQKQKDTK